jgi:hypothetical protein
MIKALSAAAAIGAVAVLTAPAANATTNAEADYLTDLQSAGIAGDSAAYGQRRPYHLQRLSQRRRRQ